MVIVFHWNYKFKMAQMSVGECLTQMSIGKLHRCCDVVDLLFYCYFCKFSRAKPTDFLAEEGSSAPPQTHLTQPKPTTFKTVPVHMPIGRPMQQVMNIYYGLRTFMQAWPLMVTTLPMHSHRPLLKSLHASYIYTYDQWRRDGVGVREGQLSPGRQKEGC